MPNAAPTLKSIANKRKQGKSIEYRGTAAERGYGSRWVAARAAYLRKHPLCLACRARGLITIATVVDHRVPHKGDSKLFWDKSNWQSLCRYDHNRKTVKEDGGFGNEQRARKNRSCEQSTGKD